MTRVRLADGATQSEGYSGATYGGAGATSRIQSGPPEFKGLCRRIRKPRPTTSLRVLSFNWKPGESVGSNPARGFGDVRGSFEDPRFSTPLEA